MTERNRWMGWNLIERQDKLDRLVMTLNQSTTLRGKIKNVKYKHYSSDYHGLMPLESKECVGRI